MQNNSHIEPGDDDTAAHTCVMCLEHRQQLLDRGLHLVRAPLHHQHCNTLRHTALCSLAARVSTTPGVGEQGKVRQESDWGAAV